MSEEYNNLGICNVCNNLNEDNCDYYEMPFYIIQGKKKICRKKKCKGFVPWDENRDLNRDYYRGVL